MGELNNIPLRATVIQRGEPAGVERKIPLRVTFHPAGGARRRRRMTRKWLSAVLVRHSGLICPSPLPLTVHRALSCPECTEREQLHCTAVWGTFWVLSGNVWSIFKHLRCNLFYALVQDGLQEASSIDFGPVLDIMFWQHFGRIWEALGTDLGEFGTCSAGFGQMLDIFGKIWSCWGRVSNWTPMRVRYASQ